jgi:glycosyltransferase involved in cell wall biosynthesis
MPHIPKTSVPILLVEQTIEYMVYKHFADTQIPILRHILYLDIAKMKYWELKYWRKADKVVAMSEDDRKSMISQIPTLDVDIVPNGVDIKYFEKRVAKKDKSKIVLYLGNFTWLQNREAVEILVKKIWPVIKRQISDCKLWIIGKDAKDFFSNIESADIRVDEINDVRKAYQSAWVLVAPIYGGGGTRYKNLESFASGLPVVTTSVGISGTDAKNQFHVIISDKPQEIAYKAIELLQDNILYKKIADHALSLVTEKYDWDPIAQKLSRIYYELGSKRK